MTDVLEWPPLTAHDRCDSCRSQAYVRIAMGETDLVFCGHHWNAHHPMLIASGWAIVQSEEVPA